MEEKKDTIRVVLCEPGRLARTVEIGTELADLQKAVGGGLIETYYPFEEEVCIVCNDEVSSTVCGQIGLYEMKREGSRISSLVLFLFVTAARKTSAVSPMSNYNATRSSSDIPSISSGISMTVQSKPSAMTRPKVGITKDESPDPRGTWHCPNKQRKCTALASTHSLLRAKRP